MTQTEKDKTGYIPPEIITNIFSRLPIKSLIRFQCVCKDWNSLMKTPYFIVQHHHRPFNQNFLVFKCHRRRAICLLDHEMQVLQIQKPSTILDDCNIIWEIVGSSNGLICLNLGKGFRCLLYLWNPVTREVCKVPTNVFQYLKRKTCGVGFGFSSIRNDHRIVKLFVCLDGVVSRVEVYSLNKGSWKKIDIGEAKGVAICFAPGITCNGFIFWLAFNRCMQCFFILRFDLTLETFTKIDIPTYLSPEYRHTLSVFENKLAMLHREPSCLSHTIDLWVIEGLSWIKIRTITDYPCFLIPQAIWRDELISKVYEDPLCGGWEGRINSTNALFNIETHEIKPLFGIYPSQLVYGYQTWHYAESVMPVSNICPKESFRFGKNFIGFLMILGILAIVMLRLT